MPAANNLSASMPSLSSWLLNMFWFVTSFTKSASGPLITGLAYVILESPPPPPPLPPATLTACEESTHRGSQQGGKQGREQGEGHVPWTTVYFLSWTRRWRRFKIVGKNKGGAAGMTMPDVVAKAAASSGLPAGARVVVLAAHEGGGVGELKLARVFVKVDSSTCCSSAALARASTACSTGAARAPRT